MHQMGNSTRQLQGNTHIGQGWREQTGVRAPFICHTWITSSPSLSLSSLELSDTTIHEPSSSPLSISAYKGYHVHERPSPRLKWSRRGHLLSSHILQHPGTSASFAPTPRAQGGAYLRAIHSTISLHLGILRPPPRAPKEVPGPRRATGFQDSWARHQIVQHRWWRCRR